MLSCSYKLTNQDYCKWHSLYMDASKGEEVDRSFRGHLKLRASGHKIYFPNQDFFFRNKRRLKTVEIVNFEILMCRLEV